MEFVCILYLVIFLSFLRQFFVFSKDAQADAQPDHYEAQVYQGESPNSEGETCADEHDASLQRIAGACEEGIDGGLGFVLHFSEVGRNRA